MGNALDASCRVPVLTGTGLQMMTPAAVNADPLSQIAALQASLTAALARLTALEGKPEEVAHFGASAALPNVAALASFTVTLTGLAPARLSDVLKAGESIAVQPAGDLPAGVTMRGPPRVIADGTVLLSFVSSVALSGAAPIAWAITALR